MANNKVLASKLKNRVEVWETVDMETDIGQEQEERFIKKMWASMAPKYGYLQKGQADTEANRVVVRMLTRKTELTSDQYIMYKGSRYDISHIMPNFTNNKYLDVELHLRTE